MMTISESEFIYLSILYCMNLSSFVCLSGDNCLCQGKDYRAQLQLGSGALCGANYIQVKRSSCCFSLHTSFFELDLYESVCSEFCFYPCFA